MKFYNFQLQVRITRALCAGNGNYYRTGVLPIFWQLMILRLYINYILHVFNLLFYVAVIAIGIRLTPILKTFATVH